MYHAMLGGDLVIAVLSIVVLDIVSYRVFRYIGLSNSIYRIECTFLAIGLPPRVFFMLILNEMLRLPCANVRVSLIYLFYRTNAE